MVTKTQTGGVEVKISANGIAENPSQQIRYIPRASASSILATAEHRTEMSVEPVQWDVERLTQSEKERIKSGLVAALIHDEDQYRAVLSYMHLKYPDLMDVYLWDGRRFQWMYKEFPDKIDIFDPVSKKRFDMYGLVYYDKERDMEPVCVGGSYFCKIGAIRNPWTHQIVPGQKINKHTTTVRAGRGYRLFVDPDYRRLGLAQDQWLTEAKLYRDCDVHYQVERQTYAALKVTQSIFDNPEKCYILERRNLELMQKHEAIKCVMDYFDSSLVRGFEALPENLKDFRNEPDWRFLEREGLTVEELVEPWYKRDRMMPEHRRRVSGGGK